MAHPGGAPTKYRKDFHPDSFVELSRKGKSVTQIAYIWEVHKDTIYEWVKVHKEFSVSFKKGKDFTEAFWQDLFQDAAEGKRRNINLGAAIWYTKAVLKWTEDTSVSVDQKISGDVTWKASFRKPSHEPK
jgi:hypothetical protein